MPDLEKLAIERLYAKGTNRAAALAAEIERGRARREEAERDAKRKPEKKRKH
jgi:hypothetical protein